MKRLSFFFLCLFGLFVVNALAQFRIDTLAQGPTIGFPVCIAFPPDGSNRIFFTEKNAGRVRIIRNDSLVSTPYLTVSVTNSGEQGLLGIAFHPQYPDSPYVFIYYTQIGDRTNKVVRYTEQNGVGVNPVTIMEIPRLNSATNHNGGNIHFGPDGKLYVSVGENADPTNSQDTSNSNKRGKIHRINTNGTAPADNPYPGNTLFVYGCRNSFDFTFDVVRGQIYSSENGPNCNDEINRLIAGGNYGWSVDGNCTYSGDPRYKRPLYYWPSSLPAVTGICVYRGSAFPELNGAMLVASYNNATIYKFTLNAAGDTITSGPTTFLNYGSALDDVDVGPDGFIYIANGSYDGTSHLLRLRPLIAAPTAPNLLLPVNGAVNQPRRPTLTWSHPADAASYYMQVSTDSLFVTLAVSDSSLTDTTKLLPPLSYDTKYFWRIRAKNAMGTSSFSLIRSFTTIIATPSIPVLLFPSNRSTSQPLSPVMRWLKADRAASYRIQIAYDSVFTSLMFDASPLTDTLQELDPLTKNTSYFWRVNGTNAGGTSAYSQIWKFTTLADSLTIVFSPARYWNLLSLPVSLFGGKSKHDLYPAAISNAFEYTAGGYIQRDTLAGGKGFWLKFPDSTGIQVSLTGSAVAQDTFDVVSGWNLIGSISDSVSGSSVFSIPSGIILSQFYGYNNGYTSSPNIIAPGKGYWVKVSAVGKIVLSTGTVR